jgi:hypothetical protein
MLWLSTVELQQLGVVVVAVEPLLLPILVGVDELVWQILPDGIFVHMYPGTSNNS